MRIASTEETIQHYIDRFEMAGFLNENLLNHLQLFRFPAWTNIMIEQDEQHFLYFLAEGKAQCSHYHLNGRLAVVAISTPFCAIGDFEILSEARVKTNVIATEDVTMLGISRRIVERYGADDPRFLRYLIDQLREKLYKRNSLQMSQVLPVTERLVIYMLAQPMAQQEGLIELPDKETLASLLGATPRHLNRVLKELVESGSISPEYPMVRILDRQALEKMVS